MKWPLLLCFLLAGCLLQTGCVVRYGGRSDSLSAEPLPPPADFAAVEQRLEALLEGEVLVDRVDRLRAARELARKMRTQDPRAQQVVLSYLQQLVGIEERNREVESSLVLEGGEEGSFVPFSTEQVEEVELEPAPTLPPEEAATATEPSEQVEVEAPAVEASPVPPGALPPAEGTQEEADMSTSDLVAQARWMFDQGDSAGALSTLERCPDRACIREAGTLYAEARDAFVFGEREAAGERFLEARAETDPDKKRETLEAVRHRLAALADRYPESKYIDALRRNVELVQRELEALATP